MGSIPISTYDMSGQFSIPRETPTSNTGESSGIADKAVQDVLRNIVPFQGDMSQVIQNRPQVMLPQPIHPHPAQMGQPSTNVQSTTAAGTQRNDLNSLIHGVGNIVKMGVNKKREKEDRDLMSDISLIQAAGSNPDDPHNKALLDSIASDPKKVKRLQKALGFNPLSGEEMPPETKALMKGAQSVQEQKQKKAQQIQQAIEQHLGGGAAQINTTTAPNMGQSPQNLPGVLQTGPGGQPLQQPGSAMTALQSRSPNLPQLNPVVAIQGELIKAGILPKADTSLNAMMSLTKQLLTNEEKYNEVKTRADSYNNRTLQMYLKSIDDAKQKMELEKMKEKGALERKKIGAGATIGSAKIHANAKIEAAKISSLSTVDRYKASHSSEENKLLDKAVKNLDSDIKNLDVQIASTKDDKRKKELVEEQAAKKAMKTALEQKEIDKSGVNKDDDDESILNELDDDNPVDEDRIF